MDFLPLAFLMGLLGSVHCAVMCGPIMLGFSAKGKGNLNGFFQLILYQTGRIMVYAMLGFLAGLLGNAIKLFTDQKWLSIGLGMLMIFMALFQFESHYQGRFSSWQTKIFYPLGKLMSKVYNQPYWGFIAGVLNGLVPCGMVYLALTTALNSVNIQSATLFMFLFGLGTAPLMLMISAGNIYIRRYIKLSTKRMIPWLMVVLGLVFVLRAAELGIPFLSPVIHHQFNSSVSCE